ncbi:type II toxin-antitoxin system mRNA interferase toxin, RelE/StbE family [Candidatus Peregrinibacteria bacterium CG10_big_fil_rev_8_21_14_0_10_49_10]|nr:MAG: type II toxin-antitoxin system mRNA interferase toxin, RelE/StbE family [Candidatus Peregrinibacteria bacterium CG10_big_fil_rev_8_21_14_0_10_49_10]
MKRYLFVFSRHADRLFGKLQKNVQSRILKKLAEIQKLQNPLLHAKKLEGMVGRYSFRIGDYRVIVTKKENGQFLVLLILAVGHRKDVYEN